MRKISGIIFCCCFMFQNSFSQELFSRQISLSREHPDIKYNTFIFDSDGLMWIGTSHGLYRYDGIDLLSFSLGDMNSGNEVTAIMQSKDKTIWAGYKSGKIAQLKNDSLVLFSPNEGLPSKSITDLHENKKGVTWIATAGEGVYFYMHNRLYNINEDDGLNHNHVYCFAEDTAGNIYAGTDQGIAVCSADVKKKILQKLTYKNGLPDEIIRVLQTDKNGNLWIGTQDKGICKYDIKLNKIIIPDKFETWKYGQVNGMVISESEHWTATEENGIVVNNEHLKVDRNYTSLGNSIIKKVNCIKMDNEGNIWCASDNGLIMTSGNTFKILNRVGSQKINFVHAILNTRNDHIFCTPDQQLISFTDDINQSELKTFVITNPQKLIDIISLYEDTCGYIWIGTMGDGLYRLNPHTGTKQKIKGYQSFDKASILSIVGAGNEIWLATLEGVIKCSITGECNRDDIQYSFKGFEKQKELGNYFIYKILIDSKKRIWFGTDGRGLAVCDKNKFINYKNKLGLKSNSVYSITEDDKSNIWISTDDGIYKFDGKNFINYNLENGLRELISNSILYDGNGNIVAAHQHGIDVLNINTGLVHYFNLADPSEQLNPDLNSITSDSKGNVWIGTEKGILIFNSHFKNLSAVVIPLITKVTLLSNNVGFSSGAKLKYNQNNISFDFTGVWLTDADAIKYKYKLTGYNKDWITTKDRKIIFPDLSPGNYTFNLKATTCNNFDKATATAFSFTIKKPFWSELWFRLIAAMIITAIAFSFLKLRDRNIRKLHALEKEKIKFQFETLKSQVNPHFLFNSFNTLISIIETDKDIAVEYVENLSEYFRNLINYRDRDLIPVEEELKLSSAYHFLQLKRFGVNLKVISNIAKDKNQWLLPPLVVQILLENAIKHNAISKETPLVVTIGTEKNKLIINNNINVKYSAEKSTGTGITNVVNRYALLTKEKVEVIKTETDFTVAIPLIEKI